MTPEELATLKLECEKDGLFFSRLFFKQQFGNKMLISGHHKAIQNALDRTMLPPSHEDFIPRLIINISPGYGKTLSAVQHYMARGLALNNASRYLHLSYADALVLLNSATVREIVKGELFQSMWPTAIKQDTDSKRSWHTEDNGQIFAVSTGGSVTGMRAGFMDDDKFTGALIIDDPIKPIDAYSEVIREGVNNTFNETIASRVAVETVPIIVIMQRIHYNDLSGYLLRGGSGEKWHHLNLPVIIDNGVDYPAEYTHGIPIEHGLDDGWLWPFKHSEEHETSLRSHRRKFAAQYMQAPIKRDEETALWSEATIARTHDGNYGEAQRTVVAIDPAVSNNEKSDEHGIMVASKNAPKRYTLEKDYSMKGSPSEWAHRAIFAYQLHDADAIVIEINQGGDMCKQTLRGAGYRGRIIEVRATKGKTLRAEPIAAMYEQDQVKHKTGLTQYEDELLDFDPITGLVNGKSPNRLDAGVYALTELSKGSAGDAFALASKQ